MCRNRKASQACFATNNGGNKGEKTTRRDFNSSDFYNIIALLMNDLIYEVRWLDENHLNTLFVCKQGNFVFTKYSVFPHCNLRRVLLKYFCFLS